LPLLVAVGAQPFTAPSAASFSEAALSKEPRAGADRKLTSNEEALLIAAVFEPTRRSRPPDIGAAGLARWC
jgi:hypothetical protein